MAADSTVSKTCDAVGTGGRFLKRFRLAGPEVPVPPPRRSFAFISGCCSSRFMIGRVHGCPSHSPSSAEETGPSHLTPFASIRVLRIVSRLSYALSVEARTTVHRQSSAATQRNRLRRIRHRLSKECIDAEEIKHLGDAYWKDLTSREVSFKRTP
jgi:hypothetical protein